MVYSNKLDLKPMASNLFKKNPADAYLINMHESWEIIYWCKKFSCTKDQLEKAIVAVGNYPDKVREYFSNNIYIQSA